MAQPSSRWKNTYQKSPFTTQRTECRSWLEFTSGRPTPGAISQCSGSSKARNRKFPKMMFLASMTCSTVHPRTRPGKDPRSSEQQIGRANQHVDSPDLGLKKGQHGPHASVEFLLDLLQVAGLHRHPLAHKLILLLGPLVGVDHHVHPHAAYRHAEVAEPPDETPNDRNRQRFRQGHKVEGGLLRIGEDLLGVPHPLPEGEQVVHQRVFLLLLAVRQA